MAGELERKTTFRQRFTGHLAAGALWFGGLAVLMVTAGNALLPASEGVWRWALTGVVVVGALIGFGVPAAKSHKAEERALAAEEDAANEAAENRLALTDGLLPVVSLAVEACAIASRDERRAKMSSVVTLVVATAAKLCESGSRARACWYELVTTSEPEVVTKLVAREHFGRGGRPTTVFDVSSPRGQALMELVKREATELWTDLNRAKPANWQVSPTRQTYQTFMVVPVRTATRPLGILTVDADRPGTLSDADVTVVQILGWILALVLTHRTRPNGRQPTHIL